MERRWKIWFFVFKKRWESNVCKQLYDKFDECASIMKEIYSDVDKCESKKQLLVFKEIVSDASVVKNV